MVGGDHSHSLVCLAIQVQEAVLDWLLASFLLGFVYVSVCFQYHYCYDINTVYMARLRVVALSSVDIRVNEFD